MFASGAHSRPKTVKLTLKAAPALSRQGNAHHLDAMTLDLTDDEAGALAKHLRRTLDDDPFPLAPRLDPLKAILAKLEPPVPQPEPLRSLPPAGPSPRHGRYRRRR